MDLPMEHDETIMFYLSKTDMNYVDSYNKYVIFSGMNVSTH